MGLVDASAFSFTMYCCCIAVTTRLLSRFSCEVTEWCCTLRCSSGLGALRCTLLALTCAGFMGCRLG